MGGRPDSDRLADGRSGQPGGLNCSEHVRRDLGASVEQLEWTVNVYNLSFAVLLITAAALGDRYGRRSFYAGVGSATPAPT